MRLRFIKWLLVILSAAFLFNPPHTNGYLPVVAAQVTTCTSSVNAPDTAQENLDHTEDDWGVFCENSPTPRMGNVPTPSVDGESLECAITGGTVGNSNVHCYRNLESEPDAAMFTLDMAFWFTPTTCNNVGGESIVQALEFTMNKWYQGQRYEFAVQWENVGDGGPQWRYWDPNQPINQQWVPFNPPIEQCLVGGNDQKHRLRIEGAIVGGQVELRSFTIDDQTHTIYLLPIKPVGDGQGDKLAVGVQVDGNSNTSPTPYSLFIDQVHFIRWPTLLSPILPEDGSVSLTQQPTFSWNAVPGAVRYEMQLDTTNPPRLTVVNSNTLSYTPPNPLSLTTYYWRVRSVDASGHISPWTQGRCLMVQSPIPSAPQRNFFTTHTPTLTWNRLSWAVGYEIQVDNLPSFSTPLEYTKEVSSSTLAVTPPLPDCLHYWRVRAKGNSNSWSAVNSLVINAP